MNKIVHYIGLDVHKETIAVAIAPQNSSEVRQYGIIGGTLEAVDKLIKKISREDTELRFVYGRKAFHVGDILAALPVVKNGQIP